MRRSTSTARSLPSSSPRRPTDGHHHRRRRLRRARGLVPVTRRTAHLRRDLPRPVARRRDRAVRLAVRPVRDRRVVVLEVLGHDRLAARLGAPAAGARRPGRRARRQPRAVPASALPACGAGGLHGAVLRGGERGGAAVHRPPRPRDGSAARPAPRRARRQARARSTSGPMPPSCSRGPASTTPSSCVAGSSRRRAWRSRPGPTSTPSTAAAGCGSRMRLDGRNSRARSTRSPVGSQRSPRRLERLSPAWARAALPVRAGGACGRARRRSP